MELRDIQKQLQKIIDSSIWARLFSWQSLVIKITEIKMLIENRFSNYDTISEQANSMKQEISELKINYQAQQKINEDLKVTMQKDEEGYNVLFGPMLELEADNLFQILVRSLCNMIYPNIVPSWMNNVEYFLTIIEYQNRSDFRMYWTRRFVPL